MKHLAKSYDVTLAAISFKYAPNSEDIQPFLDMGIKVHTLPVKPISDGIKSVLMMPKKYPLEISFYLKKNFQELVDKLCEENKFDIGISFFLRSAEYLKDKTFKKILISEDCRTLYQTRSYQSSKNIFQKGIRWWEVMKLKKYEPQIVDNFDIVTLVANEDIAAMKQLNPKPKYRLVTNGVNVEQFSPPKDNSERRDILFTGKLSVWSNTLMAVKAAKEIMPLIWKKFPDVKLHLVGSNAVKSVLDLANDKVIIHSSVPDIALYYKQCKLFIHPHLAATGIQNKLLEAMSAGMASITTITGTQGIEGKDGVHFLLAKTNEEFANKAIQLLEDEELYNKITKNARQLIVDTHTWDIVYQQIDKVIDEISK